LDGNPICNQSPVAYIESVCNNFPSLEWLDGCRVQKGNSLVTFQNYLVSIDVYTVVDEFLKHFFTLWDSFERPQLKAMYKNNSIVTTCMNYEYNKERETLPFTEIYPRVQKFISFSRNLKKIMDLSKSFTNVFIGVDNINRLFNDLPKSRHDLTNCNIDVPYFDREKLQMVIVVSGFMEELTTEKPFLLAFTRTFTIASKNCEFYITNDQMLFRSPTEMQREAHSKNFESAKYEDLVENCKELLPTEMEEKTLKLVMLQELTKCKKEFCLK
jgi:nuclear RNA export factor